MNRTKKNIFILRPQKSIPMAVLLLTFFLVSNSIFSQISPQDTIKGSRLFKNAPGLSKQSTDFIDSISANQPVLKGGLKKDIIVEETFLPWIDGKDSIKSIDRLHAKLNKIIAKYDRRRTEIGVSVYSLERDEFIFDKNAEKLFTPASTTKLFTVMSAFYLRGDNGTIDTELYTNGYLDMDTVLVGDLFIRGQGNVFLEGDHIKALSTRLNDMGVRLVMGDIYYDEGFFDGKTDRFKYSGDADVVQKLPGIKPLILSDANLSIEVSTGDVVGEPVDYSFYPNSSIFVADNSALVSGSKSRSDNLLPEAENEQLNQIDLDLSSPETRVGDSDIDYIDLARRRKIKKTQSKNGVRVKQKLASDTLQKYSISGALPMGRTSLFKYPIKDMQLAIAGTLRQQLSEFGIQVTGTTKKGSINDYDSNRVVRIASHGFPLLDMAKPINKNSNNFIAEQLFKFNGGNRNVKNNYLGSRVVFVEMLDSLGIECEGCRLNDGSGLSRRGLLKPRAMVELLKASISYPFTDKLRQTLAIAGVEGTIRKRFKKTKARNNLIGKTGTLRNVSALAGFVANQDGETYIFSILSNGPSPYKYKRMEDEIGKALAEFYYTDSKGMREPDE